MDNHTILGFSPDNKWDAVEIETVGDFDLADRIAAKWLEGRQRAVVAIVGPNARSVDWTSKGFVPIEMSEIVSEAAVLYRDAVPTADQSG